MTAPRLVVTLVVGALALAPPVPPGHAHERPPPVRDPDERRIAPHPSLGVIRPAPDFALLDPQGRTVRLSGLRGRVVLLSFIYTACPAACPLVTQRMAALQTRLRRAGLFPARVALLSITVAPERDTARVLRHYASGFDADPAGWRFLRESPEQLQPVLAAYDEWTRPQRGGEIEHPARLHLVDQAGRVREIYSLAFFDERQASLDIQALLRERP